MLGLEEAVVALAKADDVPEISVRNTIRAGDQVLGLEDELTVIAVAAAGPDSG